MSPWRKAERSKCADLMATNLGRQALSPLPASLCCILLEGHGYILPASSGQPDQYFSLFFSLGVSQ